MPCNTSRSKFHYLFIPHHKIYFVTSFQASLTIKMLVLLSINLKSKNTRIIIYERVVLSHNGPSLQCDTDTCKIHILLRTPLAPDQLLIYYPFGHLPKPNLLFFVHRASVEFSYLLLIFFLRDVF